MGHNTPITSGSGLATDEAFSEDPNLHTIRVESRSWMFRRQDGTVIHARIEDAASWSDFTSDLIDVKAGSILRVSLHHLQTIELDASLQTRWTVLDVPTGDAA